MRLLNITAEAVAQDVGCVEAGRIFARLADLLARGLQPPAREAITLSAFDFIDLPDRARPRAPHERARTRARPEDERLDLDPAPQLDGLVGGQA